MLDKPMKLPTPPILNAGLGIGVAGYFQRKMGRQGLVLLEFLISNKGTADYNELLTRFTWNEGFASDSTVKSELARLERKRIVTLQRDGDSEKVQLTPDFTALCQVFEVDVPEILQLYFDPKFIRCAPIFHGRMFSDKIPPFAFVLMPFAKEFEEIYRDHIVPTVTATRDHFECRRADEIFQASAIMETVWGSLVTCEVVISDLSTKNPNVFYETGIAHTLGKVVILLSQSMDDVPFDLRHLNVILYEDSYRGCLKLRENLAKALQSAIS